MVKLSWREDANDNLIQIYNYIYEDSAYYAVKTVNGILKLADNLKFSPYMGRKVPEYNLNELRELIYKSYRIIYEVQGNRVFIRRIWHSARLLPQKLIS